MAPLGSMIARVARHASTRCVSLATRSGKAGGDLILGSRPIAAVRLQSNLTGDASSKRSIQLFGCAHHGARRPLFTRSFHGVNSVADRQNEFVAQEKDMESDEAIWACLYQRWCKHFKMERDHDEMVRRFGEFKNRVLQVHQVNRAGLSYRLAINKSADTSVKEKRPMLSKDAYLRFKALAMTCGQSADD